MIKLVDITNYITDGVHGDCENEANSGYYFVSVKDLEQYKINYQNARQITRKDYVAANKRTKLENGDVLFANSGDTIGKMLRVKESNVKIENTTFQKSIAILKPNPDKINETYFYYLIKYYIPGLRQAAVGSAQKNLLLSSIRDFKVKINHGVKDQKSSVNILESIDSKIELNNKINTELEDMAKTIYDYWFVQFDFPNAKGKPYKSSGGKMVWNNELNREIPEGWEVTLMQDWLELNKSGDWGKEAAEGNYSTKVTCIRGADINGLNGLGELNPPTRFILEKNSFKILEPNDIVVEISGGSPTQSTGRMAYITEATIKRFENPLICSNFCKPVTIKNKKLLYNFAYYWNSLYDAGIFFGYEGKTSGIKNFLFDSFVSSYYTVVPEDSVVNKFSDMMENIQTKKQTALAENQQLASLRDWLLPMLMNGQVKVGDAQKMVEEKLGMVAEDRSKYKSKNY